MLDLYKDLIIDHSANPRNKYIMDNFTHFANGINYLCGDKFNIYLLVENDFIKDISFDGCGCSISTASASLLTVSSKGKSVTDVYDLFFYFIKIVKNKEFVFNNIEYYNLNTLSNIRNYPARVKCATLIWHTLADALNIKN